MQCVILDWILEQRKDASVQSSETDHSLVSVKSDIALLISWLWQMHRSYR